ncbi:hypothetical protein QT971_06335 [Microcoleus sp. herbarium19]|uniref:hypothetical protein n=1 Tax=Microcoleus sp. herbarium19 TaxID=3055440 RepID=UPI002FD60311
MGLSITIFVDQPATPKQVNLIKGFDAHHLPTLVDGVNGTCPEYLKNHFTGNSRFLLVSEFISLATVEELVSTPDIAISFNDDTLIEETDWICIYRYLEVILLGLSHPEFIIETGKKLLNVFVSPALLQSPPIVEKLVDVEHYQLSTFLMKEQDTMLIQVEKPFCDLPYTVVIKKYSQRGIRSFFTDLFIAASWGVSRRDYAFLERAWEYFDIQEEYNIEKMLLEATQRCFPQEGEAPEAEPVVYRRPIENVLDTIKKSIEGCQVKPNNDAWNVQRLEKRKREDTLLN